MALAKDLWVAYTRIFFVELSYWLVSIGMVFVNEFVLSANILTDDLTVFITIFQILFSLGILITLNYITKTYPNSKTNSTLVVKLKDQNSVAVTTKLIEHDQLDDNILHDKETTCVAQQAYPQQELLKNRIETDSTESLIHLLHVNIPQHINLETCKLVLPLSILYIGMLLLNNFCLKYVGVAFYFVSRSLTTVFNVIFTYFLINERVSLGALICCTFIVIGFILGIDQESVFGSLSVIGVVFGVGSSLFTSLFSIYTKKTLSKLDKNIWILILYNDINAIILCTPLLIIHGDVQALISDKVISPSFWFLLSISGVMSFFISIVTNASIKYTSPLTHNISGTAKACFQTVIAVIYQHDHKSTLWWVSNFTILFASAAYSRIKQLEMEKANHLSNTSSKYNDCKDLTLQKLSTKRRESNSSIYSEISHTSQGGEMKNCCFLDIQASNRAPA